MAERRELQTRCRELKAYLPPEAKCTASNDQLRAWIAQAELRFRPAPPTRPAPAPTPLGELGLINDLIGIITFYTIPFVTYDLTTLDSGLASRLAYGGLWKQKTLVERHGLVFDDEVLERREQSSVPDITGWHTYYRLVAKTSYGTAAILFKDGSVVDLADQTRTIGHVGALDLARSDGVTIKQTIKKDHSVTRGVRLAAEPTLKQGIYPIRKPSGAIASGYLMIDGRYRLLAKGSKIPSQSEEVVDFSRRLVLFRDGNVGVFDPDAGTIDSVGFGGYVSVFGGARAYSANGRNISVVGMPASTPSGIVIERFDRIGILYYTLLDGSLSVARHQVGIGAVDLIPPLPAIGVWSGAGKEVNALLVDGTIHTYDLNRERWSRKYATSRPVQALVGISDFAAIIY